MLYDSKCIDKVVFMNMKYEAQSAIFPVIDLYLHVLGLALLPFQYIHFFQPCSSIHKPAVDDAPIRAN
jgi:hypothetical protein